MICYAIIDTNVLVSSLLKRISIPALIVDLVDNKGIIPIFSDEIIREYIDVLCRKKFDFEKEDISYVINKINRCGIKFNCKKTNVKLIDEEDVKFYDLFKSVESINEVYLITGNKKHFPGEKNIVTPSEFLEIIGLK